GALDRACLHLRGGAGRLGGGGRGEDVRTLVPERLRIGKAHEPQLPALALRRRDGGVGSDLDAGLLRAERDRAALAHDVVAVAGDELALGIQREGAVARVALARRRLHHEEAVALDRSVERVAGALDRT